MAAKLISSPLIQELDASGDPYSGGKLYIYDAGTTTERTTYSDSDLAVANTNPLIADSAGRFGPIFLAESTTDLKLALYDSDDVLVWSQDDVPIGQSTNFYAQTTAETSAAVTPTDYSYEPGNVKRYGAVGDGLTDDTDDIANAFLANTSVFFPEGNYLVYEIEVTDGHEARGAGMGATTLTRTSGATDTLGVFYANSGAADAFVENLTFRDMTLDGRVSTLSFSEQQHLVSLSGVDNVSFERVKFSGFRGDGIYLGSIGGERHNKNVSVIGCFFDGVNSDNRNAISVIDCDGLIIKGNHFYDCSRSNMPGAIDIEPNANVYHVNKNVVIADNTFKDVGGGVAVVGIVLTNETFTTQPENFIISNNVFDQDETALYVDSDATSYTRPLNVQFENNSGRCSNPCDVQGYVRGLRYCGNQFYNTGTATLGFELTDELHDAVVSENILSGDDATSEGFRVRGGSNIIFDGNIFRDQTDFCYFLGGSGVTLDGVRIVNSKVESSEAGVEFNGGTLTCIEIVDSDFRGVSASPIEGTLPADLVVRNLRTDASNVLAFGAADATPSVLLSDTFETGGSVLTITDLDEGYAGKTVTIISKAAITFDVTGTDLNGGTTDLVTASGDITRWFCEDGAEWHLIGFMDASVDNSGGA